MFDSIIEEFKRRRAERLAKRGYNIKHRQYRKSSGLVKYSKKELLKGLKHFDEPDGEEEQNNNNNRGGDSGKSGGHGNTRLPYGLCKRYGIEIGADWTPRDAWDALAGKGITADGAYRRLKDGKDPGIPDNPVAGGETAEEPKPVEVEEPKKPVDFITTETGSKVTGLETRYSSWSTYNPYTLRGKYDDAEESYFHKSFGTKGDMMYYLKGCGVEEIMDPETGELVNPSEMEFPELIFKGESWDSKHYSSPGIGLRKGRYAVTGTDLDGKKRVIDDFSTFARAKKYLEERGVTEDKIKMSPKMKKREEERVAWLTSDKKEWVEVDGVRFGDLRAEKSPTSKRCYLEMENEAGESDTMMFASKSKLMTYLKEQGVESCKVDGETVNPQEYKPPEAIARIEGEDYQKLYYMDRGSRGLALYGNDLDGDPHFITSMYWGSASFETFKKSIEDRYGVPADKIELTPEVKSSIDAYEKEAIEKEKRKAEFAEKSVLYGGRRLMNPEIKKEWGHYSIYGYNESGDYKQFSSQYDERSLNRLFGRMEEQGLDVKSAIKDDETKEKYKKYREFKDRFDKEAVEIFGEDYVDVEIYQNAVGNYFVNGTDKYGKMGMASGEYTIGELAKELENQGIDPVSLMKMPEVRKAYEDYKVFIETFNAEAHEFGGVKYADLSLSYSGDEYSLLGKDERGRTKIVSRGTLKKVEEDAAGAGLSVGTLPMDDETKKAYDKKIREREAVASGEYHEISDGAYKNVMLEITSHRCKITGVDVDGNKIDIESFPETLDDAMDIVERYGVTDYRILDKATGIELERPKDGMRRVRMLRAMDGTFKIMATKGADTVGEVHSAKSEEEARAWLLENGIDSSNIKIKGMNPNDDVKRTHTCISLKAYDTHKQDMEEKFPILDGMTMEKKQEVVNMLTDLFTNGAFVMRMKRHIEDVYDTHFKNLLETGTSGGSTDKTGRRITGQEVFGHDIDIKPVEAEKYGFLGLGNDEEQYNSGVAGYYGDILYTFRKDRLKDRVTYMFGDSLDTRTGYSSRALAGYAGDKPTYEGVSALGERGLSKVMSAYKKFKNGSITFSEFYEEVCDRCTDGYVECQYHDMLTMDDVESIVTSRDTLKREFDKMDMSKRKKVIDDLEKKGITIKYEYAGVFYDGYHYLRKEYGFE